MRFLGHDSCKTLYAPLLPFVKQARHFQCCEQRRCIRWRDAKRATRTKRVPIKVLHRERELQRRRRKQPLVASLRCALESENIRNLCSARVSNKLTLGRDDRSIAVRYQQHYYLLICFVVVPASVDALKSARRSRRRFRDTNAPGNQLTQN